MNEPPLLSQAHRRNPLAPVGDAAPASARGRPRERVTIDLRGIGARLHALCATRGVAVSAAVREAVLSFLDDQAPLPPAPIPASPLHRTAVKLTLRVEASHAARLVANARAAAVSQGAYIAALLDGVPPGPKPTDHGEAIQALLRSTQQIATLSTDLHACQRLGVRAAERFRDDLSHLGGASPRMSEAFDG